MLAHSLTMVSTLTVITMSDDHLGGERKTSRKGFRTSFGVELCAEMKAVYGEDRMAAGFIE